MSILVISFFSLPKKPSSAFKG